MVIIDDELRQKTLRQKILYTRIYVMDFNFITVGEITGVVCGYPSYTNDATSDIRRTMTIELCPIKSDFDFGSVAGSKIWLDKYIKVEVGMQETPRDEIMYFNMGTYVIDNPSMTYSATENKITLNCLDLMARLTGVRGGVIEGIPHIIPKNMPVRDAMIAILEEAGIKRYIVEDCEILIPNDITVDGGATVYDMLKQLVDLLPNYQIYFDVDGIFHYNMIPNGQNEGIMVDDSIWRNSLISYDMNYDFENIKNYIEIIGGVPDNPLYTFEPYYRDTSWDENPVTHTTCITPSYEPANEILAKINNTDDPNAFTTNMFQRCYIALRIPEWGSESALPIPKVAITRIDIRDGDGVDCMALDFAEPLHMEVYEDSPNMAYILLEQITDWEIDQANNQWVSSKYNASFMSGEQPHATIFETNPESIFRTGIDYYCDCEWGGRFPDPIAELYINDTFTSLQESVYNKVLTYDITGLEVYPSGGVTQFAPCWYPEDYAGAEHFRLKLYFQSDEDKNKYELKATLDATPELLCVGSHTMKYNQAKSQFETYDVDTIGTLRIVLSGDEYENIWSQDLAEQRAKFELYQRCRLQDNLTITCLPIYWLDTNWLIEITLPNEQSGKEETAQYLIKSISTDGTMSGTQTITLVRYYPYYPII